MADRAERIRIFKETMQTVKNDPALAAACRQSMERQMFYPADTTLPPLPAHRFSCAETRILSRRRTFEAAASYAKAGKHVCVLNFASAHTPGGGVTRGASAQEECLCRISTLYPALTDSRMFEQFYRKHRSDIEAGRMGRENNSDCIFTPAVTVIRADTDSCAPLPREDWYQTDVITCAAPDLRYDPDAKKPFLPTESDLDLLLRERTGRILSVAALHSADVLILGAFGCGVFCDPPKTVAKAFEAACDAMRGAFETVEFAVYCTPGHSENYDAFSHITNIKAVE